MAAKIETASQDRRWNAKLRAGRDAGYRGKQLFAEPHRYTRIVGDEQLPQVSEPKSVANADANPDGITDSGQEGRQIEPIDDDVIGSDRLRVLCRASGGRQPATKCKSGNR